jgi:hypothetical protein
MRNMKNKSGGLSLKKGRHKKDKRVVFEDWKGPLREKQIFIQCK